jgi:hypothetical protein
VIDSPQATHWGLNTGLPVTQAVRGVPESEAGSGLDLGPQLGGQPRQKVHETPSQPVVDMMVHSCHPAT